MTRTLGLRRPPRHVRHAHAAGPLERVQTIGGHRRSRERGTMALEMVILAPVLLVLFMFLLACGRYFQTGSLLESAARDGARGASQARSLQEGQTQVDKAVTSTMSQAVKSCKETATGTITTAFTAGSPLSVEVSCTINYRDLGLLGLGGDTTITKRFTSSLDPYRGVRGDGS